MTSDQYVPLNAVEKGNLPLADASKPASSNRRRWIRLALLFAALIAFLSGVIIMGVMLKSKDSDNSHSTSATVSSPLRAFALAEVHLYNKTSGPRKYTMQATQDYVIQSTLQPVAKSTVASTKNVHNTVLTTRSLDPSSLQLDTDTLYMLATMASQAYNEQNANPIVCDQTTQDCTVSQSSDGGVALYTENNVVALVYQELTLDASDYQNAINGQPMQNPSPTGVVVLAFKGTDPTSFNDLYTDDYIYRCPSQSGYSSAQSTATSSSSYVQAALDITASAVSTFSPSAIVFTGHSLGGTLAMVSFVDQNMQDSIAVPFSAPPSGLVMEYISQPTGNIQGIYEFYTQGDPLAGATSIVNAQCYPGQVGVFADTTGCSYIGCHSINVLLQNIAAEDVPSYGYVNDNSCLPCGTF